LLDEPGQRQIEAGDGGLRFGGLQPGGIRFDRSQAVVEANLRRVFGNGFDHTDAVLEMADLHANV